MIGLDDIGNLTAAWFTWMVMVGVFIMVGGIVRYVWRTIWQAHSHRQMLRHLQAYEAGDHSRQRDLQLAIWTARARGWKVPAPTIHALRRVKRNA